MYIPILLTVIILILISNLYIKDWKNKKKRQFAPIKITISPLWRSLLVDYGLINEEECKSLIMKINEGIDRPKHNVLSNGINFTILKADENAVLIYNEDTKEFNSVINFRSQIQEIEFDMPHARHPFFYIRNGIEGYEIGIATKKYFNGQIAGEGEGVERVAILPYCVFGLPNYDYGIFKSADKEKMLKKYGWKTEERDEFDRGSPYILSHMHFQVNYTYI